MNPSPDVLLLIATGCSHCPSVLQSLSDLVKDGQIGQLEVVNIMQRPERAQTLGVRSVPWVKIGPFELTGMKTKAELQQWIERLSKPEAMSDYFAELMLSGEINKVTELIRQQPGLFTALLRLVADEDTSMSVRIGAGAVIEEFAGSDILKQNTGQLIEYLQHKDARIRNDACYYLGLSHDEAVIPAIRHLLDDEDEDVRETAQDSLQELEHNT